MSDDTEKRPARADRATGALDLILYAVAVGIGILIFSGVRIGEILGPNGPAVTVAADAFVSFESAGGSGIPAVTSVTTSAPNTDPLGRLWFVLATLLVAAAAVIVVVALMRLAFAVRRGHTFSSRTTRSLAAIGVTLTIAAFLWPVVDGLGRERALSSLGIAYEPLHLLELLPLAPIFVAALTAGVLAAAFAHGERLQRDTEGLV